MKDRIQKNLRIRRDVAAEFAKISTTLGMKEQEAAEIALSEWIRKHQDEAQKKLDLYAERAITIIEPQSVNIAVFQKAEILVAKEELRRLLDNLDRCNPEYRTEIQVELARALKRIHPIFVKTRDSDIQQLLTNAEEKL